MFDFVIDRKSYTPAYVQLKEFIKKQILKEEISPGEKLPTENELTKIYSISRMTARKALAELLKEKLIVKKRPLGTFVQEKVKYKRRKRICMLGQSEASANYDPFNADITSGIKSVLDKSYSLFYHEFIPESSKDLADYIKGEKFDAVLIIHCALRAPLETVSEVLPGKTIWIYNKAEVEGALSVYVDARTAMRDAVIKAYEIGHRKMAYLYFYQSKRNCLEYNKYLGVMDAIKQLNRGKEEVISVTFERINYNPQSAYSVYKKLLSRNYRPTCVFALNDYTASGVMKAASDAGQRMPEDVSVVGFDNMAMSEFLIPSLATMNVPKRELGVRAGELLVECFGDGPVESQIKCQADFVWRDSFASPGETAAITKKKLVSCQA